MGELNYHLIGPRNDPGFSELRRLRLINTTTDKAFIALLYYAIRLQTQPRTSSIRCAPLITPVATAIVKNFVRNISLIVNDADEWITAEDLAPAIQQMHTIS